MNISSEIEVGSVRVITTENRGHTPEEIASLCAAQIVSVSDSAPPVIRDQAREYRNHIESILAFYMKEAIKSDRTTVCNAIKDAGHPDLSKLIRRL
jgi:hypothetical protein|tara:strand:- start:2469 stop:2756 length:288 start_codon:yes stop_codon:yes gene_type:complete